MSMYSKEQVSSIFRGAIARLNESEKPFHVITTDHPYMVELGLSSFTVQELYQWLSRANKNNYYINSFVFTGVQGQKKNNKNEEETEVKYAAQQIFNGANTAKFSVWRKYYNNNKYIGGKYTQTDTASWIYVDRDTTYRFINDIFDKFNGVKVDFSFGGPKLSTAFCIDNFISNIINMNDWYRYNLMLKDRSEYDYLDNVVHEFILDIKSSLEKCISWTTKITFNLNINNRCQKEEDVTFKLFLYDENKIRDDSRKLSISNPIIIQPKADMFNRVGSIESGEIQTIDQQNVSNYVASELDIHFNESTGKWESGTKQTIAILKQNIEAATIPSIELIEKSTVQTLLEPGTNFVLPTGLAYPITQQNSNAQQWSPTYKKSKNCRGDNNEKFEVIATNINPVPYSSGQTVMLSKMGGAWIITEMYTPKQEEAVDEIAEHKWDFMYIFANYDNYFRNKNFNIVTSEEFHDAIVNKYYFNSDSSNALVNAEDKELNYNSNIGDVSISVENSYFQVTSWDFMGSAIGGLRKGNALGRTIFNLNENGSVAENNGKFLYNDDSCVPFFGCCFPDGYDAELKYQDYMDENSSTTYHRSSYPQGDNGLFFIEPKKGDVFKNFNDIKPTISSGIFLSNIKHLPADIALNASESGVYGSPLKNIKSFDILNDQVSRSKINEYFFKKDDQSRQIRNNWLYINENPNESFFDFKPVNPNKISFRPLRAEIYAAYESWKWYDDSGLEVDSFGIAAKKQLLKDPSEPIISTTARNRNLFNNNGNNNILRSKTGSNEDSYLAYNRDLINLVAFRAYSDSANYDPFLWENQPWLDQDGAGGGAVGIIAAQYTLKTGSDIIRFTTDNFIGMPSRLIGLGVLSRWIPTYGSTDRYWSFNTTQLFAKIYHAWPREQTIYDPRFFTVFHFNNGVNLFDDSAYTKKKYYTPNGEFDSRPPIFPQPGQHTDEYKIEYIEESSVDIRIPTLKDGRYLGTAYSQLLTQKVFSDGLEHDGKLYEFHSDQKFWYIEAKRRGKILPYKFKYYTIGIDDTPYNVQEKSGSIYIETQGEDYVSSDTFTVIGGNGNGVILKPILGGVGNVVGFEVVNPGRGFLPSDFLASTDLPNNSRLKIVCNRAVSNPLTAYVKNGLTLETESIDAKPQLATSETEIRLTPPIKTAPSDQIAGANAMTDQILETEVQIINKNTTDYKYDIFLHFHNDISHTFYLDTWSPGIPTYDQNITLEITTS